MLPTLQTHLLETQLDQFTYIQNAWYWKKNLKIAQEKNVIPCNDGVHWRRKGYGATETETQSKVMKEKENQILELLAELSHTMQRVKQPSIGFVHLSKLLAMEESRVSKKT